MAKYAYPAVFTKEENGQYSVNFPDVEDCYTCGDSITESIENAEDVLALMMFEYEDDGRDIPVPSSIDDIKTDRNEFVSYIAADTMAYRKKFRSKAIKKTLTIPEWLNDAAIKAEVNFSQVLQEALTEKLKSFV